MGCVVAKDGVAENDNQNRNGNNQNNGEAAGENNQEDNNNNNRRNNQQNRHRRGNRGNNNRGGGNHGGSESDDDDRQRRDPLQKFPKPQLEGYWVAGTVVGTNEPPMYVPTKGPWSTLEKVPPLPPQLQGTFLFRKQAEPETWKGQQQVARGLLLDEEAVAAESNLQNGVAAGSSAEDALSPLGPSTSASPIIPAAASGGKPPLTPVNPNANTSSGSLKKSQEKDSNAASGSLTELKKQIPMPPPISPAALAESQAKHQPNSIFKPMTIPRIFHQAPPAMQKQQVMTAVGYNQQQQLQGYLSRYILPRQHFVARAMLPHSLANYSVGWVKLPVGPLTNLKQTLSGGGEANANNNGAASSDSHLIGYLAPSKPVYDVAVDGPVENPFTTLDRGESNATNGNDDNGKKEKPRAGNNNEEGGGEDGDEDPEEAAAAELKKFRHMQKYFLYIDTVLDVGISVKLQSFTVLTTNKSSSKEGPQEENDNNAISIGAVEYPSCGSKYCAVLLQESGKNSSAASGMNPLPAAPATSAVELAAPRRTPMEGTFFSFALPPSNMHWLSAAYNENSLPLFVFSCLEGEYESWWHLLQQEAHLEVTEDHDLMYGETSTVPPPEEGEESEGEGEEAAKVATKQKQDKMELAVNGGEEESKSRKETLQRVAQNVLSAEQKMWLLFRKYFNEALVTHLKRAANKLSAEKKEGKKAPVAEEEENKEGDKKKAEEAPLLDRGENFSIRTEIDLGIKFRYDNQRFVAFNSTSALQSSTQGIFSDQPLPAHHQHHRMEKHHAFLQFIDCSRSPAVEISTEVCSGKVELLFENGLEDLQSTVAKLNEESAMLKHLFQHYLPTVA